MTLYKYVFIQSKVLLLLLMQVWVNPSFSQESISQPESAFLGSFHLGNYVDNNQFTPHEFVLGVAFEYRKQIDSLSNKFYLTFGLSLETIPVKIVGENDDYFTQTHFNFTMPLGLYYRFPKSYYTGLFASLDIPFAQRENSEFGGVPFRNTELNFRYLNINFSAGMNIGKMFIIRDRTFMVELHFKALGLLGLKSNDYWHYPEGGIPYYTGFRLGYGF